MIHPTLFGPLSTHASHANTFPVGAPQLLAFGTISLLLYSSLYNVWHLRNTKVLIMWSLSCWLQSFRESTTNTAMVGTIFYLKIGLVMVGISRAWVIVESPWACIRGGSVCVFYSFQVRQHCSSSYLNFNSRAYNFSNNLIRCNY